MLNIKKILSDYTTHIFPLDAGGSASLGLARFAQLVYQTGERLALHVAFFESSQGTTTIFTPGTPSTKSLTGVSTETNTWYIQTIQASISVRNEK